MANDPLATLSAVAKARHDREAGKKEETGRGYEAKTEFLKEVALTESDMRSKLKTVKLGKMDLRQLSELFGEALRAYRENQSDFENLYNTSPALQNKKMHEVLGDILAVSIAAQAENLAIADRARGSSHIFPFCWRIGKG